MKKKTGVPTKDNEIREIDVSDLIQQMSRGSEATSHDSPRSSKPKQDARPPGMRKDKAESDSPIINANGSRTDSQPRPSIETIPIELNQSEGNVPPAGKLSRSKKQKLRLLRKLQERQSSSGQLQLSSDESSGDEMSSRPPRSEPPSSPESASKKSLKLKRNYVERTSSSTGGAGCSWKDVMCISLVALAIMAAGALKFQEEMFGSVERMRLETDSDADFYEILGIPHSASVRDIKRAYRNKVLEVHPDHHPNCADCQEKFIACTKAYETLMDDEKRKIYDQTRGSYEPIVSDHSVSLTSFNYHKLVDESSHVWVVQVYDDLDGNSRYFGSHWDTVAGSDLAQIGIKFGRINARRDKAVLSFLPMRAKMFPTVIMFSRDTMPSIFSLADISSKALRRWILANLPSHVGETSGYTVYKAIVSGGKADVPPPSLKVASIKYAYIFDVDYEKGKGKTELRVVDKRTNAIVLTQPCVEKDCATIALEDAKRRLVIPLNRYNIRGACQSDEVQVYCVQASPSAGILTKPHIDQDETVHQRVVLPGQSGPVILDLAGSMVQIGDEDFVPLEVGKFIEERFPLSVMEKVRQNAVLISVAGMFVIAVAVTSRFSAVQLTIAIAGFSILVGAMNAISSANVFKLVREKLFS